MIGLMETHHDTLQLKNGSLFRQRAYLDGQWCDAESGATIRVLQPRDGCPRRHGAPDGDERDPPGHRGRQQGHARVAGQDSEGARRDPAPLV